jgi:hypothetical protein
MKGIMISNVDGKIMIKYERSWWTKDDPNEQLHYRIESAFKLQNLINQEIKENYKGFADIQRLQELVEESKTTTAGDCK